MQEELESLAGEFEALQELEDEVAKQKKAEELKKTVLEIKKAMDDFFLDRVAPDFYRILEQILDIEVVPIEPPTTIDPKEFEEGGVIATAVEGEEELEKEMITEEGVNLEKVARVLGLDKQSLVSAVKNLLGVDDLKYYLGETGRYAQKSGDWINGWADSLQYFLFCFFSCF